MKHDTIYHFVMDISLHVEFEVNYVASVSSTGSAAPRHRRLCCLHHRYVLCRLHRLRCLQGLYSASSGSPLGPWGGANDLLPNSEDYQESSGPWSAINHHQLPQMIQDSFLM